MSAELSDLRRSHAGHAVASAAPAPAPAAAAAATTDDVEAGHSIIVHVLVDPPADVVNDPAAKGIDALGTIEGEVPWFRLVPVPPADVPPGAERLCAPGAMPYRPLVVLPDWMRGDLALGVSSMVMFACMVWLFARGLQWRGVSAAPVAVSGVVLAVVVAGCVTILLTLDRDMLRLLCTRSFLFLVGIVSLAWILIMEIIDVTRGAVDSGPDSAAIFILFITCSVRGLFALP